MLSPKRKEYIETHVDLRLVAEEVAGVRWMGNKCSCPFGSDSTPSMYYYPGTNTIYCFHCSKGYGAVWLVSQINSWSLNRAATWLENTYKLKKQYDDELEEEEDEDEDDEDDEEEDYITFEEITNYFSKWMRCRMIEPTERMALRDCFWAAHKFRDVLMLARSMGRKELNKLKDELYNADDNKESTPDV